MTLIVHTDGLNDASRRLINAVDATQAPYRLTRRPEHLESTLRMPLTDGCRILLYHAASAEALDRLEGILKRSPECKLLLVLPDGDQTILRLAYRLVPRFVTDQGSDFTDIAGVIKKIHSNQVAATRVAAIRPQLTRQ